MPGYDYGNARIRAKRSHLLARRELDSLAEAGTLQGLIAALIRTAYRKAVETALARSSEMDCIADALRQDLISTFEKARFFFTGEAAEMAAFVFRTYDVQNLKAVLHGLSKQAAAGEILSILLPVGELQEDILTELARSPSPRVAIDVLASMGSLFAAPLVKLRAENPGVAIPEMELALDRWFFKDTSQHLLGMGNKARLLLAALKLDADIINLLTVLRFAHAPGERKFLQEWFHTDKLETLLIGPGQLDFPILVEAGSQDSVRAAVDVLEDTPYEIPLNIGLKAYAGSALLSDLERQLKRFRLIWKSKQVYKDPLGIGVLIGFVALKVNEVRNIRWVAQGISLGLKAEAIRAELEYPQ